MHQNQCLCVHIVIYLYFSPHFHLFKSCKDKKCPEGHINLSLIIFNQSKTQQQNQNKGFTTTTKKVQKIKTRNEKKQKAWFVFNCKLFLDQNFN